LGKTVGKESRSENNDMGRFNFKKLCEMEIRKQLQIGLSNRFAAFQNLYDSDDINRDWENIKQT
jgi:hypothetical protein